MISYKKNPSSKGRILFVSHKMYSSCHCYKMAWVNKRTIFTKCVCCICTIWVNTHKAWCRNISSTTWVAIYNYPMLSILRSIFSSGSYHYRIFLLQKVKYINQWSIILWVSCFTDKTCYGIPVSFGNNVVFRNSIWMSINSHTTTYTDTCKFIFAICTLLGNENKNKPRLLLRFGVIVGALFLMCLNIFILFFIQLFPIKYRREYIFIVGGYYGYHLYYSAYWHLLDIHI